MWWVRVKWWLKRSWLPVGLASGGRMGFPELLELLVEGCRGLLLWIGVGLSRFQITLLALGVAALILAFLWRWLSKRSLVYEDRSLKRISLILFSGVLLSFPVALAVSAYHATSLSVLVSAVPGTRNAVLWLIFVQSFTSVASVVILLFTVLGWHAGVLEARGLLLLVLVHLTPEVALVSTALTFLPLLVMLTPLFHRIPLMHEIGEVVVKIVGQQGLLCAIASGLLLGVLVGVLVSHYVPLGVSKPGFTVVLDMILREKEDRLYEWRRPNSEEKLSDLPSDFLSDVTFKQECREYMERLGLILRMSLALPLLVTPMTSIVVAAAHLALEGQAITVITMLASLLVYILSILVLSELLHQLLVGLDVYVGGEEKLELPLACII